MKVQYKKITIHTPNLMNYDQKAYNVFKKKTFKKLYVTKNKR